MVKAYLKEKLDLDLSEKKTLITNANKEKALFLGTRLFRSRHRSYTKWLGFVKRMGKEIRLEAPLERITRKLEQAKFIKNGVALPRFL